MQFRLLLAVSVYMDRLYGIDSMIRISGEEKKESQTTRYAN